MSFKKNFEITMEGQAGLDALLTFLDGPSARHDTIGNCHLKSNFCAKCSAGYGNNPLPPHKLRLCSACKNAAYCDKDCQKAHWSVHKAQCLVLREKHKKAKVFLILSEKFS